MNSLLICTTSKSPAEASRRWAATIAQLLQRSAALRKMEISSTDAILRAQELLRGVDVRANNLYAGGCQAPDFCNSDDVVFSNTSDTAITEDYFVKVEYGAAEPVFSFSYFYFVLFTCFQLEEDAEAPPRSNLGRVNFERRALDDIFLERVRIHEKREHEHAVYVPILFFLRSFSFFLQ
jgi:hypothetical protein